MVGEVLQFISSIKRHVVRDVDFKMEETASIETSLLAVDEDSGFIVDCSEMQQHSLATPRRRHVERGGKP